MRICVHAAVLAVLLLTGRTAFADSIVAGDTLRILNDGGAIYGGVFQVHDVNLGDPADRIDLLTFCVQLRQDINSHDDFEARTISTIADDESGPDPLDVRTAWIYWSFRQGALSGYTENEIQSAIWVIEEEWDFAEQNVFFSSMAPDLENNATALMNQALAATTGPSAWVNTNVRLLNLFFLNDSVVLDNPHSAGDQAQDLLMLDDGGTITTQDISTPEPATLILVGSGAVGLIRRHLKRRRSS